MLNRPNSFVVMAAGSIEPPFSRTVVSACCCCCCWLFELVRLRKEKLSKLDALVWDGLEEGGSVDGASTGEP